MKPAIGNVLSISPLANHSLDTLHDASLKILAQTGVNVHCPELRSMLKSVGAVVKDELRVHIPSDLVTRALATAPPRVELYDRNGKSAMILENAQCYFGTGSDLEYTMDGLTCERRRSTLNDVKNAAKLCDKLPNIDFVMSYALPRDVTTSECEVEQFRVMLENTTKPIIMTLFSGRTTFEKIHQLACRYGGGERTFRGKPNYIMYGQFVSPLQHDSGALERLVFCADHGIPLIYVPTIMMGASGPVTLAGALALANAECLAGLVIHQLRSPGAPFIYGGCVSPLDMSTTVFAYNSPEWRIADVVLSQLSRRYKLPVFGTAGATDAKAVDAQAGAEWAYSLLTCALAGTNLIHDVGYLASGMMGSLEALVICDELVGMVKRVLHGFEIDETALALEVIHRVGPGGNFLEEQHTLDHFRNNTWYPSLFSREHHEKEQGKDLLTLAHERAIHLLED
ncbi:MAG: trimethylamine methyltransferase family protein [Phycisphaerae bacterium]